MLSRKITSICLMVSLLAITTTQWVSGADVRRPDGAVLLKEKVELFGVGANVKVKLANGQKVKGPISSIVDTGFALAPEPGAISRSINYDQVSELTLVSKRYRTSGSPDASEARRVIAALGAGNHVVVRTSELKIHGQIMAVERDHFVILPDDQAKPVQIAYQDVQQAGKNMSVLSKIGLAAIIVVAIVVVVKVKG
jgi:hypothetical protein